MRNLLIAGLVAAPLALAGCSRNDHEPPAPAASLTPGPIVAPTDLPSVSPEPSGAASLAATLDTAALAERRDPDRVVRYYVKALESGQWAAAARAWGARAATSADMLEAAFSRTERPSFTIGTGTQEGAAGSLFYEVPVTVRFGASGAPEAGTLTLRRVNDVDGATADQLRWHIENSTIGGQR